MRLSLVFELLLIFVLLAFAASRVIDSKGLRNNHRSVKRKSGKVSHKNRQDVNKYCSCSTKLCNCCREFNIPLVAFQGPGCATLQYLQGDRLAISMSFGERVLTNTTISGRKPKPVCMPLPGGVSKFCGRVYNIGRQGEDFKACLGLELRALQDIEASLRVSCFRFGPKGLKVERAQPLPVVAGNQGNDDDYDDDDDDDEDDYDFDDDDDYDADNDVDSEDYTAFSVFDDDFAGLFEDDGDSDDQTPVKKVILPTKAPARRNTRKPSRVPPKVARKPAKKTATAKPLAVKTTSQTKKVPASTTTARTVMVPVVTIAMEKKPEISNVNLNSVSSSQSDVQPSAGSVPSSPHESIAAVTAMLQDLPGEMPQVAPVDVKPAKLVPGPAPTDAPASSSITTPVAPEVMTAAPVEMATEQPIASMSPETSMHEFTQTMTESSQKFESTTMMDTTGTTELFTATTEDEDDISTESVENLILKSKEGSDDEDDDDEDNDDDDDDDDDDSSILTDPISSVVEEVLGVEEDTAKKNKTKKDANRKSLKKNNKTKKEASMLDDIVDGVFESITGEEVDDSDSDLPSKDKEKVKNNDEDGDEDEDDRDDDEENDDEDCGDGENGHNDDDEDEDEDEARKTSVFPKQKSKTRQSKDMWLERLHWN